MKTFLILIVGIVGLFVAATAVIFALKACPPKGPWPTPPWCGTTSAPVKEDFEDVLVVPTDLDKIAYPDFYQQAKPTNIIVSDPYCLIEAPETIYPATYLGAYPLPQIKGAPLQPEIKRVVGFNDVWTSHLFGNPNNNDCLSLKNAIFSLIGKGPMFESYEKTLSRAKMLGGDTIAITNYILFSNFKTASVENERPLIDDTTLRKIVKTAKSQGVDVLLYLNLGKGLDRVNDPVGDIPNDEWLATLIDNYSVFLLNQAKIAEETGIKGIMLNHFDYNPSIRGHETAYQNKMLELIEKVRSVYSGQLILLIDPFYEADLAKISGVLSAVDGYIFTSSGGVPAGADDKTVSVGNLKRFILENLKGRGDDFGKYNKPFYIRILIQSHSADGFQEPYCIQRGADPCYLLPDFSVQAIAYEAMMEAINEAHGKFLNVEAVDAYGYSFTDVLLPQVWLPQISHSVRNKPAESVVFEWFKRLVAQ